MKVFSIIAFAIGSSALAVPSPSCTFGLIASGPVSGTLGQLPDGQIRIGGGLAASVFTIKKDAISDSAGRSCILTPAIEQFQCDTGIGPTIGFAISASATLTSSGSPDFYACPASDAEWNVYTTPVIGQSKCEKILLSASGCGVTASTTMYSVKTVTVHDCSAAPSAPVPASSFPAPSTPTLLPPAQGPSTIKTLPTIPPVKPSAPTIVVPSSKPPHLGPYTNSTRTASPTYFPTASGAPINHSPIPPYVNATTIVATPVPHPSASSIVHTPGACATTLSGPSVGGNYQWPHLIVPISSDSPATPAGTSYFGTVSSNTSTIFNFDIPTTYAGTTCSLIFLLPLKSQLETADYTLSGAGGVQFQKLSASATTGTTFNSAPSVSKNYGGWAITEGSSTLIDTFACPAGERVAFELSAIKDTYLHFFQDWNPSPLGLYITVC